MDFGVLFVLETAANKSKSLSAKKETFYRILRTFPGEITAVLPTSAEDAGLFVTDRTWTC